MFNVTNLDTWYIFEVQNTLLTNWIDEIGWISSPFDPNRQYSDLEEKKSKHFSSLHDALTHSSSLCWLENVEPDHHLILSFCGDSLRMNPNSVFAVTLGVSCWMAEFYGINDKTRVGDGINSCQHMHSCIATSKINKFYR